MFDGTTAEGTVLMYFDTGMLADIKILDACAASIFSHWICVCVRKPTAPHGVKTQKMFTW